MRPPTLAPLRIGLRLAICLPFLLATGSRIFACSTPPTLTISLSWPSGATIQVTNVGLPANPFTTALLNWNSALNSRTCSGSPLSGAGFPQPHTMNVFYTSIPPSPDHPNVITRGQTDFSNATFSAGRLATVTVRINTLVTNPAAITEVFAHEIGHTFALDDCLRCGVGSSVMESGDAAPTVNDLIGQPGPTPCDIDALLSVATDYHCSPPAGGGTPTDPCLGGSGSDPGTGSGFTSPGTGPAPTCSPIVIDTEGAGFHLTSAADGVTFDIAGDGHPVQIAWTAPGSRNAFLALDRNHNGRIDSGKELFGNFTVQPKSDAPNGFLALAEFDKPENGGNGDGIIDERDQVFSQLRLWIDENHDGISQPNELHTLPELGIFLLGLKYEQLRRRDEFGNLFRFRAGVNPANAQDRSEAGRWAFDVFLATAARQETACVRPPTL
jgi:hypothetical protein